jgi:O-antigen/teichoic acid export membrane protein
MANLAPVIVTGLSGTDPAQATGFAAAVVLTRVPLLLMGPIQALILPRLTLAAGEGREGDFRRDTGLGLAIIGGLAVLAVAGVALLGHWAVGLLVGAASDTASTTVLILLTVSAMLQMAVQFLQPALVAVRKHRALVIAWVSGGVVFGLAFLVPLPPIDRGVLAQLAGPVVTLVIEVLALRSSIGVSTSPNRSR